MNHVAIDAIDPTLSAATTKRDVTTPLGATHLAINYYELAPGDSFAYGYHMHEDQEEVFLVLAGTVTFETDDGDVQVSAGDAIRFAPGEYQQGTNHHDRRVRAYALGAPRRATGGDVQRHCSTCDGRTPHTIETSDDETEKRTRCRHCETVTARFT